MISNLSAVSQLDKTPSGNTGVYSTNNFSDKSLKSSPGLTFRVDWLQGTFDSRYLSYIQKSIVTLFGSGDWEYRPSGLRYFNNSYIHPSGVKIGVGRKLPSGFIDSTLSYLEMSGTSLLPIKQSRLRKFMLTVFRKCQFKSTRVDVCIDDFEKTIRFTTLRNAVHKFNYSGFGNTIKITEGGRDRTKGWAVSFGKRGSQGGGKYLVIYDKDSQSKGVIPSVRLELSGYDHYATHIFRDLINSPFHFWGEVIGGWIKGSINFISRKGSKNPSKCKQLSWWSKLVLRFFVLKPSLEYKDKTIDSIKDWLKTQVSSCLYLVLSHEGLQGVDELWAYFWELIFHGESKLNNRHKYLMDLHNIPF